MDSEKELKKKMNNIKRIHEKNLELYERKLMLLVLKEMIKDDEVLGDLCRNGEECNSNNKKQIFNYIDPL